MATKPTSVFGNQPAQYVILDLGFPMTLNARENMIIALQNALSLACFMQGSKRIPSFGMSVINSAFQPFIKLMPTYRNYSLISKALKNIINMNKSRMHINTDDFKDAIHVAISTALDEFRTCCEQMECNGDMNDLPSQIQINVFSMKDGVYIQNYIESAIQILPIVKLKKIQVIHLTDEMLSQTNSGYSSACGFVELLKVPYSVLSIEKFLKTWLLDCNTDAEKLNLMLPGIVLKCDTVECLINPLSLPCGENYQLQPTGTAAFNHQESTVSANRLHYDLEVVSRLSADGLCESQVYGQPVGLVPTKCWKLDRTQQVFNQQCFQALCKSLLSSKEYMIAKMCTEDQRHVHTAYFVLLADIGIILAKPLAGRELVLPVHEQLVEEESSQAAIQSINRSLMQLSKINEYLPSKYECGIYKALQNNAHYLQEIQKKTTKPPVAKKPASGAMKRASLNTTHPAVSSPQEQSRNGSKSQKIVHFFKPISQIETFFTE